MAKYCCDELDEALKDRSIEMAMETDRNRSTRLSVPGCCGGQCSVLSDLKHCPFCGADVTEFTP